MSKIRAFVRFWIYMIRREIMRHPRATLGLIFSRNGLKFLKITRWLWESGRVK